jgi:hypothetical protein
MLPPTQAGAALIGKVVTPGFTAGFESQQSVPTSERPIGGVTVLHSPIFAVPTP